MNHPQMTIRIQNDYTPEVNKKLVSMAAVFNERETQRALQHRGYSLYIYTQSI
ncbi:MAG: hypothetical protein HC836_48415 [Richelia sp. RM2_1_2]|nr:hypothetical protein [Richelia sp. SM2_1_7]NJM23843.1 hypothetical protein [Richelia sp. SM1_7_0]NJO30538.1 hypothetical protein [Richelia sp. SL_2_1]NJO65631.1 hypothetical protein [Richelia sp. RM2_1_2]